MLTLASNRLILLTLEKKPVCSILMYNVFSLPGILTGKPQLLICSGLGSMLI